MQQIRIIKLTEKEKEALLDRIKKTVDREIADRLRIVWFKANGYSHKEIAKLLNVGINTITRCLQRYRREGLEGICRSNYAGSNSALTLEQRNQLKIELVTNIYNTAAQVIFWVEKNFDVTYTVSGMQQLLKRLGFTWKKNRLMPSKADPEAQRQFVHWFKKLRAELGEDDRIYFVDACHAKHNAEAGSAWSELGNPHMIPANSGRNRYNILGAYCTQTNENEFILTEENINQDKLIELLDRLHAKHQSGKIYLVLDNASYNHAKRVKKRAELSGIILKYQPPYSPNLNLIERLWKFTRKEFFKDKYRATFQDFREKLNHFFNNLSAYQKKLTSLLAENFELIPQNWSCSIISF
jgi:transposase